ncbi:MAG: class I SAM-dependent methyltransferase [bacterium]
MGLVDPGCDICGSFDRSKIYDEGNGIGIFRCNLCGLIYVAPRPASDFLASYYSGEEYTNLCGMYAAENLSIVKLNLRDGGFFDFERKLPPIKRALDIGCGSGEFLEFMRDRGWECYGVDVGSSFVEKSSRKGVNVHWGELSSANYEPNFFDFIHASHVLEHVFSPSEVVREVRRIIRPAGMFMVVVPNVGSPAARLMGRRWRGFSPPHAPFLHLSAFSRRTIRLLLEREGFKILRDFTYGGIPKIFRGNPIARAGNAALKALNFGDVVVAVATKKKSL